MSLLALALSTPGCRGTSSLRAVERGELALAEGRPRDAERDFEAVLVRRPQDVRALRGLGRARLAQDQVEAALAAFDTLERLDPGYLHVTAGRDHARALTAGVEKRLAREPPDGEAALAHADHLALSYPDAPGAAALRSRALGALGDGALAAGEPAAAEAHYRQAIRADPDRLGPVLALGRLLLRSDRADEAVRVLTLGLERHPDDPRVQRLMVDALTHAP